MLIQSLLEECGVLVDLENVLGGQKAQVSCPVAEWTHEKKFDSHPSAIIGVSKTSGELYFHCFTCKTSGSLGDLVFDYADYSDNQKLKAASLSTFPELNRPYLLKLARAKSQLLSASLPLMVKDQQDHTKAFEEQCRVVTAKSAAAKYLKRRHIDGETCRSYQLRYDRKNRRIVLPVFSKDAKIVTAVGRALDGYVLPKYYNYYTSPTGSVLGGLQLFNNHKRIVLVEGFFDMLNLARHSKEVLPLCCFGARLTDEQATLISNLYYRKTNQNRFLITLMYDGDAPGKAAVLQAASKLIKSHIPTTSINVIWLKQGEDPGSLKQSDYVHYLERAQAWRQPKKQRRRQEVSSLKQLLKDLQPGS